MVSTRPDGAMSTPDPARCAPRLSTDRASPMARVRTETTAAAASCSARTVASSSCGATAGFSSALSALEGLAAPKAGGQARKARASRSRASRRVDLVASA